MATTPAWQAATSGQLPSSTQVNQLLGTHQIQYLYTGVQRAAQTTAGSGNVQTNGLYIAQSFSTSSVQTSANYVLLNMTTTGGLTGVLPPTTISLHANNSGAPAAAALVTTTLTAEYVFYSPSNVSIPVPLTGVSPSTTYWLVMAASGDSSHHFNWNKSNQTSGASTSPDGTTWTAQSYGLLYQVYDQTLVPGGYNVVHITEDSGSAWSWLNYNANGTIANIAQYTPGQTSTATSYVQSYRTVSYSGTSAIITVT